MTDHPAYRYAADAAAGKIEAPRYVRKQCEEFAAVWEGRSSGWIIDRRRVELIGGLTELMNMPPKSLKAGMTVREAAQGHQWLLWIAALCTVRADNPEKRRYTTVVLEIARKNAKTFDIAVFFILLFFTEPKFSKFYSVAPDGKLSREVKDAVAEIVKSSPDIEPRFRIMRDYIRCSLTENEYIPLNYSNDRLDGKLPSVFLVDEAGGLPNNYAIEAMQSGQLTIRNKLGCIVSTKYPRIENPMEDEIAYSKRVLDGLENDPTRFSLLYEPDNPRDWMTDERVLMHANPLGMEVPEIWDDLLLKRQRAIAVESARENFLCKHCNILYQGVGTESYVSVEDVRRGRVEEIDWRGREVFLGLDLSMSNDNCSVGMAAFSDSDGGILAEALAFIPEDRIERKNAAEKIDYRRFIREGKCFACGGEVVDYGFIEETVLNIEKKYGVTVIGLGFDRYNAMSTAQKLEDGGIPCTQVEQHSRTLHPATKRLAEVIAEGRFHYTKNTLLEINFQNAKCTYDTNLNRYVNKKKSNAKVDMVVALINAVYMLIQEELHGWSFVSQT